MALGKQGFGVITAFRPGGAMPAVWQACPVRTAGRSILRTRQRLTAHPLDGCGVFGEKADLTTACATARPCDVGEAEACKIGNLRDVDQDAVVGAKAAVDDQMRAGFLRNSQSVDLAGTDLQ